jgi:hypothetical protein
MLQFEFILILLFSYVFISTLYFPYNFGNIPQIYCKSSLSKTVCSNKNSQYKWTFLYLFVERLIAYKLQGFWLCTSIITCSAESNKFYSRPSEPDNSYAQGFSGEVSMEKAIW